MLGGLSGRPRRMAASSIDQGKWVTLRYNTKQIQPVASDATRSSSRSRRDGNRALLVRNSIVREPRAMWLRDSFGHLRPSSMLLSRPALFALSLSLSDFSRSMEPAEVEDPPACTVYTYSQSLRVVRCTTSLLRTSEAALKSRARMGRSRGVV